MILELPPEQACLHLRQDLFSDITLKLTSVDGERSAMEVPAHKIILSSFSPYFLSLLTNGMKETGSSTVDIKDDSPEALGRLLCLLYTHRVPIECDDDILDLLRVATKYQFQSIVPLLETTAAERLNTDNFLLYQDITQRIPLPHLEAQCLKVATEMFADKDLVLQLSGNMLLKVVQLDTLRQDELEIFKQMVWWLRSNKIGHGKEVFKELLQQVRYENVPHDFVRMALTQLEEDARTIWAKDGAKERIRAVTSAVKNALFNKAKGKARPMRGSRLPAVQTGAGEYSLLLPLTALSPSSSGVWSYPFNELGTTWMIYLGLRDDRLLCWLCAGRTPHQDNNLRVTFNVVLPFARAGGERALAVHGERVQGRITPTKMYVHVTLMHRNDLQQCVDADGNLVVRASVRDG